MNPEGPGFRPGLRLSAGTPFAAPSLAPAATTRQKQAYADSVAAFVGRYPNHGRAREVYTYLQIDFARELVS